MVNLLKIVQSLLTAILVGLIIVQHKLDLRSKNATLRSSIISAQAASGKGWDNNQDVAQYQSPLRTKLGLAIEVFISSIHTAPFVTYDYSTEMLGKRIYYRLDSILCGFMFLR